MSSNDSNNSNELNGLSFDSLNGLTPPETPPDSDRSSPPNFSDLSTIIPSEQTSHQLSHQLSNVTLVPAVTLCPSVMSPSVFSPFIPNNCSMIRNDFKSNDLIHNNNNINTCINNNGIKTNVSLICGDNKLQLSQLKREARKLRNREAASISRKRKKEYVDNLEERIISLVKQNTDLRNENEKLKHKIACFEEERRQLSKRGFNYSVESNCNCRPNLNNSLSNKKAALSLLAVIFMLGLNLAPFSGVLITNDKGIASVDSNLKHDFVKHGPSRTLLWETSNDENLPIDVLTARENAFNSSNIKSNSSYNKIKDTNCKTYINQTESLRLESDLRGWVLRVKMEKEEVSKQKKRLIKSNKLKDRFNKPIPLPRLKAWTQRRTDNDISDINDYALESYNSGSKIPQIKYEDLLSAIHRRDDTFYFLSFSAEDHLIIPPIPSNGSEIRPRFSLIMPSIMPLNESSSQGTNVTYHRIVMMQIDCEVINTKMVLLNSSPNSKPSSESVNNNKKPSVRINGKTKPVMGLRNPTKAKNKVQ